MINYYGEYYIFPNEEALDRDPYTWKGSSTKKGNSRRAIAKRRKKNKNKKTHRR